MKIVIMMLTILIWLQTCRHPCFRDRNEEIEREKVANTIDAGIGWVKNKDLDLLYKVISQDSTYLCVNPGNRIVYGFDQFKESVPFWMDDNFQYIKHEIRDLKITFSKSGEVAWFFCRLNDINTWRGEPASWENVRWTGVLEKMKCRWVIRQQHFSFEK
ncbi:MAG: nuclear transport factor 2 family protein [Candidatus Marinimicrobia bacterium]|nr:nuclear transport factor 2 family protein [Candidatus Neomarinimicrobiota bacterium]